MFARRDWRGKSHPGRNFIRLAKGVKLKKGKKYDGELPQKLYSSFLAMVGDSVIPSFSKFARSMGMTVADLTEFRKNKKFDKAWCECIEIRRDYLIDCALTRRYDPSFVKFLLSEEFESNKNENGNENEISVSIKVIDQ